MPSGLLMQRSVKGWLDRGQLGHALLTGLESSRLCQEAVCTFNTQLPHERLYWSLPRDRRPTSVALLIVLMHSRRDRGTLIVRSERFLTASRIIPVRILSRSP